MDNQKEYNRLTDRIKKIREELHKHPEDCFKEIRTGEIIKEVLEEEKIPYREGVAKTGIVATIDSGKPGQTIAFRCDMDGLPMEEETGVDFASENKGYMHACGHDAHMTMVLGAGLILNRTKDQFSGKVILIFQPAEEHGIDGGAKFMIEEGVLSEPKVDYIFGMHVWPDLGVDKIGITAGQLMASGDPWRVTLKGKAGHISMPHKAINPLYAASQLIQSVATIRTQKIDPFEDVVIDIGHMTTIDGHGNVIPKGVYLAANTRCYKNSLREEIKQWLVNTLDGLSKMHDIDYDLEYHFGYAPVINDEDATNMMLESAKKVFKEEGIEEVTPVMGAEDFGEYLQHVKGSFAWIGVEQEEYVSLHNSKFFVTMKTIEKGILLYCQMVKDHMVEGS